MASEKGYKGLGMEGGIASWYAKTTKRDLPEFQSLADRLAQDVPDAGRVLEVAPGPGYLSIALAKKGRFGVTGLDISRSFVRIAAKNALEAGVAAEFRLGNASEMPFEDATFDLVACRAAFKNFTEPVRALDEMCRVLKPGGRAVIIDLRKDVSLSDVDRYVRERGLGWFDGWMVRLIFRFMLVPRAYTVEQMKAMASESRFGGCEFALSPIGMEVCLTR